MVGVATVGGKPAVLTLSDNAVFVVSYADDADGAVTATVRRLPLRPGHLGVELTDNRNAEVRGNAAHVRRWKFSWAEGPSIEFDGMVSAYRLNSASSGPDSAERFAHALAGHLGWELPDPTR